ncbi:SusC/RagA family TonB-linked outer membrane protein [Algibacter miyuki]|uniref:SusC/RagA family TonB-linked outer membrane protein n=1 Tax=Algibacter miyuki TaxID=1306933 RepID=A0ABV5GW24_9FLAO|nr:TonB-dependent receptor [Algibacter miyuki]MDN3665163.1 TonB-dependent receptor [Algibacter miyuki]
MRTFIFLCITTAFSFTPSNVLSQNSKIKIEANITLTVDQVFDLIMQQTDYKFIYQESIFENFPKIDIKKGTISTNKLLNKSLSKGNYNVTITDDNTVIVKEIKKPVQLLVTGTVSDENGQPLAGATIIEKGTANGAYSDFDGNFSLKISNENAVIVFTSIGFTKKEVPLNGLNKINVTLKENTEELDDVTVVAFGKQKKGSVIGSITTINPSELKVASSNLTTSLAGRVAGIIAYQRSGEPGEDNADFFIRGVTTFGYKKDPLILIDGIELTSTDLARLQTDDIASFSIMKDATATALYGARGANGVILVTTKEGKEGKAKLSFRVENSFSMPTRNIDLADPVTYMQLSNEAIRTRDPLGETYFSDEKIDRTAAGENPLLFPANDWHDMLFKNFTQNQRYNLNLSGGGKVARYYVAGSYSKDSGILKVDERNNFNSNINLQKYTLRSNVNIDVTPTTELIVRLNGNFDDYSGPIDGGTGMYNKVMHSNPALFPAYYPIDEDHKYVSHIMFGNAGEGEYINPYADMVKGYKEYSRSQMIAQLEFKEDLSWITEGLRFRTMANTIRNSYFSVNRAYNPFYYGLDWYNANTQEYGVSNINESTGTEYLDYNEGDKLVSSNFYVESAINYSRKFNKHDVSGLLITIMKHSLEANAGDLQLSLPYRNLGLSGRFTYAYDDRYHAELNFGYNGSERFHKKNRFGFFPSAGVAWNVSNEPFWENNKDLFSKLRIRATYGLVGNDAIGSAQDRFYYLSNVNMNSGDRSATFGRDWGYSRNGVALSRYGNEDITWEVSKKANLAFEIGMFNNKLDIQAEFFKERRSNIFMPRADIPVTMGLATEVSANVGEASGQGTDISLEYNESWGNGMWLSLRGNFTYATSKFEVYEEPDYDEAWRSRVGTSLGQQYGYIAERLFIDDAEVANAPTQSFGEYMAGDIKYLDVNGDGKITQADQVPIGYPTTPEIVYGFGFSFGYKSWDFSSFFQGLANESFWIDPSTTSPFQGETQILKAYADSHWSEDYRDEYALWPRLSPTTISNNTQNSTWFMRDGSFLRLKEVEIGYTLPEKYQKKIGTSNFRVYMSATNFFTLSKFKLWDVEMGGNGLGYPIQKILNIGLNVSIN